MFDLEQIRPALKALLDPVGVQVGAQVLEYPTGNITPPSIEIMGPDEVVYDIAGTRGGDMNIVIVRAWMGFTVDQVAYRTLDKMLKSSGPLSLKQALEAKDSLAPGEGTVTLGGLVDDLRVTRSSGYRVYPQPAPLDDVLGADWYLQIETTD